jgi:hypothetical protein
MIKTASRLAICTYLCFLAVPVTLRGAGPGVIAPYEGAPTPVSHAAHRLSDYTGIPLGQASAAGPAVRIELNSTLNPKIGQQGYKIHSEGGGDITIEGNSAEGAANGVYTFLRTLMIEHRKDPFSRPWDVQEKPQFPIRMMIVAPYRFGASYGFAALSPDRWSFEEWKEYVDFMRLCNMTTLTMGSERMYHPDYPNSWREKWRYEVWKQVMEYCHQVGMKFDWFISPNLVTEQSFWDNPDKRALGEAGNWYGNGLNWSQGKDLILKNQRYTLEYFRGMDGLEIICTDGGGLSFDDATGANPAAYFADATRSYMQLMREVGNDGEFIYWNWVPDIWSKVFLPGELVKKYPKFQTLQDDVIPLLPKNVAWLDASMLTIIQSWTPEIKARGTPSLREGLLVGKEHGFRPIIDFFWYMNPEISVNMFPHPLIRRGIQEARYARDEIGADGTMGYRLAPPCRFMDDYVFFRLSSDPNLTQEQLVSELAALLAEKPENRQAVKEAISTLEQFWTTHKLADIERAEKLLRELLPQEHSKNLEYISDGVTFLSYVVRMAQPGVTAAEKDRLKRELYQTAKSMYIFQGLTADIVWVPEAIRFFNARVDMMVEDYNGPDFARSYPEVVDRDIYPKATSQPYTPQWPK